MPRKPKSLSAKQRYRPKPKRSSKLNGALTIEMLLDAVRQDNFIFLEDNLPVFINKQRQCIGESKTEERLLDKALQCNAKRCTEILLNWPYNVKHHNVRDLFQAFSEDDIWKVEATLQKISTRFDNLRYNADNCSVPALLLRPLDVLSGMEECNMIDELSRPKRRNFRSKPVSELCNLFFELVFSTPELYSHLDGLEGPDFKGWYLLAPIEEEWQDHLNECIGFPQCLLQHDASDVLPIWDCTSTSLSNILRLWTAHRFKSITESTDLVGIDPPSLLECCRIRIRIWLVSLQQRRNQCPNYWTLVNRLPIPPKLRDFLLFKELWPSAPPSYYSSDDDSTLSDLDPESMYEMYDMESMGETSDFDDYY